MKSLAASVSLFLKSSAGGILLALAAAGSAFGEPAPTPPPYSLREHYTKYEYDIPMRDGIRLHTTVYAPKDGKEAHPFLLERTPYSCAPYGVDEYASTIGPSEGFMKAGYIFVQQDVRGRYLSEGTLISETPHKPVKKSPADVDESSDTHDTVEWLLANIAGNNGKVGIWGISYIGFYTTAGIIDTHPAIKAASPQAPMTDEFLGDDLYHGGAYMLNASFGFYTYFKPQPGPAKPPKTEVDFDYGTSDAYEFFLKGGTLAELAKKYPDVSPYWREELDHPTYDAYWKERAIWKHVKSVNCAVLTVGGWFDAENLAGSLRTFRSLEDQKPTLDNHLVMGPWYHGGWCAAPGRSLGHVDFAADTSTYYNDEVLLPFFEHHLKGKDDPKVSKATVFETGTNVWRHYPSWPAPGAVAKTLYLRENYKLSFEPPAVEAGVDRYVSDPARPVPFIGYTAMDVPREYMVSDQRFASTRPDVLVYTTDELTEDVTFAGPVSPRLFVATTGTDSDWVVKLIDVYPPERSTPKVEGAKEPNGDIPPPKATLAGYQQLVRGEPFRGKFRKSFETPEPFIPGKTEEVRFAMPDINHTFRRGHRIMVHVQSSWFPLVDRNPQTFVNIPTAKPEDFKAATESVQRSAKEPSGIEVYVLPTGSGMLPKLF